MNNVLAALVFQVIDDVEENHFEAKEIDDFLHEHDPDFHYELEIGKRGEQ